MPANYSGNLREYRPKNLTVIFQCFEVGGVLQRDVHHIFSLNKYIVEVHLSCRCIWNVVLALRLP